MVLSKPFDLPRLWFAIYRKVLALNQELAPQQLDRNQLREVVTSIFIASTGRGRGIIWPVAQGSFEQSILDLLSVVTKREDQEKVYRLLRRLVRGTNGAPRPVLEADAEPGT